VTQISILDASALGEFLLDAEQHPSVGALLSTARNAVVVPHLCDVEIASGFRSMIARRVLTVARAAEAMQQYTALPLQRVGHLPLLSRVLSLRDNFTAYDGTYVALAESLGVPLHTSDARLARAVREHTAVEVVEV
jgi:predicted nucleic acid-binding protein